MGDFSTLAIRIKKLRASMKKTQREFAKYVGCTAATLSAYENGSKSPSLEIIKNIAEKCHVSIDWLCGLSERMRNDDTPQTYADVIDLLVKVENALKFKVNPQHASCIAIYDSVMQYFLDDWAKMLPLFHSGTIDSKLYKLWLDDKKKEYRDVHIRNENEIEEFLMIMEALGSPILSVPNPLEPPQE